MISFSKSVAQDSVKVIFFDTSSFHYGHLLFPVEGTYTFSSTADQSRHSNLSPKGYFYIEPLKLTGSGNKLVLTSFRDSVSSRFLRKIDPNQGELFDAYTEKYLFHKKHNMLPEFLQSDHLFLDTVPCEYLNPFGDIIIEDTPVFFDMTFIGTDTLTSFQSYLRLSDSIRLEIQPKIKEWTHPFFMKETEVTNREYRSFVHYVRDSIALHKLYDSLDFDIGKTLLNCDKKSMRSLKPEHKQEYLDRYGINLDFFDQTRENDYLREEFIPVLSNMYLPQPERYYKRWEFDTDKFIYRSSNGEMIPVYPDTTCWNVGKSISVNPEVTMYFWHPAFDDYPVVGLNFHQMKAYCEWYERKLNNLKKDQGISYTVDLPELHHYEMAARLVTPVDLRNEITVCPTEPLSYQRDEWDAEAHLVRSTVLSIDHPNGSPDIKFNNWLKTNGTFPLFQLLGGTAEVIVVPGTTEDQITILGGDRYLGLYDTNELQINTLFYKRMISPKDSHSTVGFRPVINVISNH